MKNHCWWVGNERKWHASNICKNWAQQHSMVNGQGNNIDNVGNCFIQRVKPRMQQSSNFGMTWMQWQKINSSAAPWTYHVFAQYILILSRFYEDLSSTYSGKILAIATWFFYNEWKLTQKDLECDTCSWELTASSSSSSQVLFTIERSTDPENWVKGGQPTCFTAIYVTCQTPARDSSSLAIFLLVDSWYHGSGRFPHQKFFFRP